VDEQFDRTAAQSDFSFTDDEPAADLSPPLDRRQRDRLVELIGLHRPALLKYVKRMLVSAEDAEDIVQESCIRLLRVRDLWRSEREARAVLFKIATNLARDEMRRRKTRRHGHHQPYETLELVAEQEHVDEILDQDIARQVISQTLLRLPARYREVFNLHVEGHLSYRAIARQLGVSTKTVERDMSGVHELCLDRFEMRRAACA
jgi:RNA polymerase sigma-70 factor (ECF subfamily)